MTANDHVERAAPNRLPSRTIVGRNIRRLKTESRRSWKAIAADADVDVRHLYNWAGGLYTPQVANLKRLAEALGVSLDELVRDDGAARDEKRRGLGAASGGVACPASGAAPSSVASRRVSLDELVRDDGAARDERHSNAE